MFHGMQGGMIGMNFEIFKSVDSVGIGIDLVYYKKPWNNLSFMIRLGHVQFIIDKEEFR